MLFEYRFEFGADHQWLLRIAEQIADQAHIVGMGNFNQHNDVGALRFECGMDRMPDPLMAVEAAFRWYFDVVIVEAQATVTDPFRAPLKAMTGTAALQQQTASSQTIPKRPIEIGGKRYRQTGVEVGFAHSVASLPKMQLLTGVTIGPEITIETSARGTCAVEVLRIWRTASMLRPRPCI